MLRSNVNVFCAKAQPATRWVETIDVAGKERRMWFRNPAHRILCCYTCSRPRLAKNMCVRPYYDCTLYFCRKGGCAS